MKFKEHYELWNFSELEEWSAHSDIPRDREIFCHSVQSVQMILKRRWRINGICVWSIGDLTEVFPCFFLGCKAKARVILAKTGNGPQSSKIVVLFYVLFVLYRSMYCLCVNVYYCHRVTTQLQLTNISYDIISKLSTANRRKNSLCRSACTSDCCFATNKRSVL